MRCPPGRPLWRPGGPTKHSSLGWIRTSAFPVNSRALGQLSFEGKVAGAGFEPAISGL
jgi:hypothetical protein